MKPNAKTTDIILSHYPATQAIYLFGSYDTSDEWEESDVDIAILLTPDESKKVGVLVLSDLRYELEKLLKKDVDLTNLRQAPTVLQKEIITADRRIYCANQ